MKEMVTLLDHEYIFTDEEIDSIKSIFSMEDPSFILNSLLAYKYLEFLLKNSSNPELYESLSEFERKNFIKILLLTMRHVYLYDLESHLNTFEFEYKKERQINHQLNYLYNITGIIHNWTYKSKLFATEFLSIKDGLVVLFELLNNKLLISKILDLENSIEKDARNYISKSIYRNVLVSIYNLSYLEYQFQLEWKNVHAFFSLMHVAQFSSSYKNMANFVFVCYLSIANIFHDSDVSERLSEIKLVLKSIVEMFSRCIKNMRQNEFTLRMNVYETSDKLYDVTFIQELETKWNFIEITSALNRLCVNDTLKNLTYADYPILDLIKDAIRNGNEVEKDFSIKLLWQLCFSKKIALDLVENFDSLVSFVRQLFVEKREFVENKRLLVTISNFMYYLRREVRLDQVETSPSSSVNLNHVVISYHQDNQAFCMKLKSSLEMQNFRVWALHDEKATYSRLESCFKAIENGQYFLMLMSERYKQDECCRAEAEHAFKLNKDILPIIVRRNYAPSGWLQRIIQSRLTIDAANMHHDECVMRIIKEISFLIAHNNQNAHELNRIAPQSATMIDHNQRANATKTVKIEHQQRPLQKLNWTEKDVRVWINEKQFNQLIVECIMPCNGAVLEQYYTMLVNVPEFFFNSLNAKGSVSLRDSGYFASELKNLFE